VRTFVRAYDRLHAVELMNRDVDYQIRETSESALAFGRAALEGLGLSAEAAAARAEDVRKRDIARLVLQQAGALPEGATWLGGTEAGEVRPEPLTQPVRPARALNAQTRDLLGQDRRDAAERVLAKPVAEPNEADEVQDEAQDDRHDDEGLGEPELETEGGRRDG
jgi:CPA2 family monovalent cation:H+ antiporter-2/glutathione-regulated potassium-efflux system protein KefB